MLHNTSRWYCLFPVYFGDNKVNKGKYFSKYCQTSKIIFGNQVNISPFWSHTILPGLLLIVNNTTNEHNLGKLKLNTTKTQPPSDTPYKLSSSECTLSFLFFKVMSRCSKPLGKNCQWNCRNNSSINLTSPYILLQARYCCFPAFALRPGLQMWLSNVLVEQTLTFLIQINRSVNTTCKHTASVSVCWLWYIYWLLNSCGQPSIRFLNHHKAPAKATSFCSNSLAGSNLCLLAAMCSTNDWPDLYQQNYREVASVIKH